MAPGVGSTRLATPPSVGVVLTTARLHIVPCAPEHLDGLHALNADPQVMRYITGHPESRAETQAMIERVVARWARWGYSWWSFIEQRTAEIIGAGCIQNLRRSGTEPDPQCPLEIAWRVRPDRWRQGIAVEAAIAMADFAFERLHATELYAVCHPDNVASQAVMRKLGMQHRGLETWYAQSVATYSLSLQTWQAARQARVHE